MTRRPEPGEVKAVAVDVDGTLADDSRRVDLRAVAALRKVQDSGVPVMHASGNVLPIAYALSNYLGLTGPIVAENGGVVSHQQRIWYLGDQAEPMRAYEHLKTRMNAERLFTDKWRETEIGLKRDVSLDEVRRTLKDFDVEVQTTGWAVHIMQRGMNKFLGVKKACELLGIPPSYRVMFLQGGASLCFAMIPMNLRPAGASADYVVTGTWSKTAAKEAAKLGTTRLAANLEPDGFNDLPSAFDFDTTDPDPSRYPGLHGQRLC